jgi:hypothetical protein
LGCHFTDQTTQAEKEERDALQQAKRAEIEAKEAKKREAALGPQKGKGKK